MLRLPIAGAGIASRTLLFTFFAASLGVLGACSSQPEETEDSEASALRTLGASEKVGDLAFGETKTVGYTEQPLYRALRVSAASGDVIDAWVRGDGLDAKAWIVNAASRTLTSNDDANASTRDAHVVVTASAAGDYYVVFRDKNGEDGSFTVSLAGRATPPAPPPTTTTPPPVPPPTGLAGLPDGTYRIPTTSYINTNAACKERFDIFTVKKSGEGFTVDGAHVTITDPRGLGNVASGRFHGESVYDPCSYCSDSRAVKYTMDGTLTYDGTRLSLSASYTGSWATGKSWYGSIDNTWFGRDESTLPAGVQRATLSLGPRYDGCAWLWTATVVRFPDGTRMMSLPDYYGDVDFRSGGPAPISSCARRGAGLSLHGATLSTYQSMSSTTCSDSVTVPTWFAE